MNGKLTTTIVLLLLLCIKLQSQEAWSLEECINYALENNIQIKQQELNAKYAENNHFQSKMDMLPTLNGYASHQMNYGTTVDPFTYQFSESNIQSSSVSINSSLTLFNGFQKINTLKKNKLDLLASIQDVEKAKNDVSLNIASYYLEVLFNEELKEVTENQLKITQLQVERTRKMVEAGSLPGGSLLEIQAQEAQEKLNVVNAENQLTLSYLKLTQLMELDSAGDFRIQKPTLPNIKAEALTETPGQVYNKALDGMPQVKSAEYQLESAQKNLKITSGARMPRLSANFTWWGSGYSSARERYTDFDTVTVPFGSTESGERVYTPNINYDSETIPFMDQIRDNKSTTISFSLNIPIFNGWQVNNNVSNARINVLSTKYQLQNTKNQLYKEIQQAYADVKAAVKKYNASEKTVHATQRSFDYTQQRFNVGMVNSVDYNDAKNKLTKARSDLLQAKYEYIFRLKVLDFYMGKPLTLK